MEQQLKQRLMGAIVLVSLAVIFVPVILEGPKDEWAPRDHTIPEPPGLDYNMPAELPIPAPAEEPAPDRPEVKAAAENSPAVSTVPPPVAESAAAKPAAKKAPPEPAKTAAAPAQKQTLANGWYVQVGSFSQSDNARRLRDTLRADDIDAHLQSTSIDKGESYRVLVGPSRTRAQADKLLQGLTAAQKINGIVIEISD